MGRSGEERGKFIFDVGCMSDEMGFGSMRIGMKGGGLGRGGLGLGM